MVLVEIPCIWASSTNKTRIWRSGASDKLLISANLAGQPAYGVLKYARPIYGGYDDLELAPLVNIYDD